MGWVGGWVGGLTRLEEDDGEGLEGREGYVEGADGEEEEEEAWVSQPLEVILHTYPPSSSSSSSSSVFFLLLFLSGVVEVGVEVL